MFTKIKLLSNACKLLLVAVLLFSCEKTQTTKYEVGKSYVFSFDWKNKNPFEKVKIDTVKVVGVKNGYIQWQYKNGFRQSAKQSLFDELVKHSN